MTEKIAPGEQGARRGPRFGTLGPEGSNHEYVTRAYIRFHKLSGAAVTVYPDFDQAFAALKGNELDFIVQVAVHPAVAETVARHREWAFLIDAFISPSQVMVVATRRDVKRPHSLGLQPATERYVDSGRWERLVPMASTISVGEGLLEGRFDSGITLQAFAERHPELLRIDEMIGTVDDAWLVYGRERLSAGIHACPDSPAAGMFRRLAEEGPGEPS
jgi:hypothetical protein